MYKNKEAHIVKTKDGISLSLNEISFDDVSLTQKQTELKPIDNKALAIKIEEFFSV